MNFYEITFGNNKSRDAYQVVASNAEEAIAVAKEAEIERRGKDSARELLTLTTYYRDVLVAPGAGEETHVEISDDSFDDYLGEQFDESEVEE